MANIQKLLKLTNANTSIHLIRLQSSCRSSKSEQTNPPAKTNLCQDVVCNC